MALSYSLPKNSERLNSPMATSFFLFLHIMSFANFYNDFFTSQMIWKKYIFLVFISIK